MLQEIVDRPDWKEGNAVALLIEGSGSHVAAAFDGSKAGAPQLFFDIVGDSDSEEVADKAAKPYTVRLFFTEPDASIAPGARTFDVSLQDSVVLKNFDIAVGGEGPQRSVVREFSGVPIADSLSIELHRTGEHPAVLSGVEVIAEESP